MLKVTAVSYLNTKPFIYGLFQTGLDAILDLQLDIPSDCAKKLASGEVDLGLVPVAMIPELENAHIISDFCIGCDGLVKTVSIFSDYPIESVDHLLLDYHSRTSVALAKVLLEEFWKVKVKTIPAKPGFIQKIKGKTAGLVIGDRAIGLENQYEYVYDLGDYWKKHTGLPFVFAAWVSTKPLGKDFIRQFNFALQSGIANIPKLVYLLPSPQYDFNLSDYFQKYISYELNAPKKEALELFLSKITSSVSLQKSVAFL